MIDAMEYINQRNLIIAAGLLVVIALGAYAYFNGAAQNEVPGLVTELETVEEGAATTTQQQEDETTATVATETTATAQGTTQQQETTQAPTKAEKKELGPRQKAGSPGDALRLFAEAMVANDAQRAASYFSPHLQADYEASFNTYNDMARHPVVFAYYNGKVDPVQLIDPDNGIYEIAVYPGGGPLPFRTNYMFNADMQEFVITEF